MPFIVDPRASSTPLGQLKRFYHEGAWADAERLCEELLAANPGILTQDLMMMWGELALARGDLPKARERLRRAFQLEFRDVRALLRQIELLAQAGDWPFLEGVRKSLSARPLDGKRGDFPVLFPLARIDEMLGRIDEAISGYERVSLIIPANASASTFRSILLLRKAWTQPLQAPAEKQQPSGSKGRLAMTALGKMGRFGNQLFQYGYARAYGRVHGLRLEVPDWIGRWLFDLDDPNLDTPLPLIQENRDAMGELLRENAEPILANHDLVGYCQCHTSHLRPHQTFLRTLFQPGARLRPIVEGALERVRRRGRTLIAIHLRRGDYAGGERFWPAPVPWYLDWLRRIWPELDAPVLYIASDDPDIGQEFADFSPVIARELDASIPGAEMYPDFQVLVEADLLAISNSTFSVAAAMLNACARSYVRPDPSQSRLVPFDPWNTDVLWRAAPAPTPA